MAVLGEQISEREAAMPFFHLTSDLFWMLSYRDLTQLVSDGSEGPAAIRTKVSHASIKDTFWDMLQNPQYLEQAERALATKWWPATRTRGSGSKRQLLMGERIDKKARMRSVVLFGPRKRPMEGNEIYRAMLEIQPGDVVFHFVDNERVDSFSKVAKSADPSFVGIKGTEWEDRPAYRVELRDHQPLIPPIERAEFLGDGEYRPSIQELLNSEKGLFFNREFKLNQGAYITEAPLALIRIWNEIHRRKTGSPIRREWNLISESPLIKTPVGLWIFQGNPEHFDIDTYLRDRSNITWSVRQHKDSVHTDDRVLIWRSGAEAGIVAECLVTSEPSIDIAEDEPGLWRSSERLAKDELRCSLQVIDTFVDRRYFATKLRPLFRSYRS